MLVMGLAFSLEVPEAALGATFYVNGAAGAPASPCTNPDPGKACTSITTAIIQARGAQFPGGDTIQVAAGSYPEQIMMLETADAGNTIAGAGSGLAGTRISPTGVMGPYVYLGTTNVGAMTVRGVRVIVTQDNNSGIAIGGPNVALQDIVADMQNQASSSTAVVVGGPTASATLDRVVTIGAWTGDGVGTASPGGASVTIRDSSLLGRGVFGRALSLAAGTSATVQRSIVRRDALDGAAIQDGGAQLTLDSSLVLGGANAVVVGAPDPQQATLRHVTVDPGGPGPGAGRAFLIGNASGTAQIRDSILVDPVLRDPSGGSINCVSSDLELQSGTGVACDAAGGNTHSSPSQLFADITIGDYRLKPGSPAVDSGSLDPLAVGESPTDLLGSARVLDGNGDCVARRDKGAYELTGAACGTAGAGPADTTAPLLDRLSMSARRFRVGRKPTAPSLTRRKRTPVGTVFRYRMSEAATVTIAIERALPGRLVRSHGRRRCVKPKRRNRAARPCKRYKLAGTLIRTVQAGRIRTPFTGRLGRKPLKPGKHRATLRAKDATGNRSQKARRISFTVVRR
jgi:hypothetical protein